MSLCIWTSLHLNLPEHKKEHLQKYRKLGWMVLGLLAPELVVWNAWEQRKKVKEISALMKKERFMPEEAKKRACVRSWAAKAWQKIKIILLLQAEDWPEVAGLKLHMLYNDHNNAWTDVHSWFVVMGGIAFEDRSSADQRFMPRGRQRVLLTVDMFEWIVKQRPRLVSDISRAYIEDKSKSDWLAKGLTCWQAGYFCIQCTFRLSQGLSITLLELNVFAHSVCALLLFLIWWDKPRDVSEPTLIFSEEALNICACFCHADAIHSSAGSVRLIEVLDPPPLESCLEIVRPTTITARAPMSDTSSRGEWWNEVGFAAIMGSVEYDFLTVQGTYWKIMGRDYLERPDSTIPLTGTDIRRLMRVSATLKNNPDLLGSTVIFRKFLNKHRDSLEPYNRMRNWDLGSETAHLPGEGGFRTLYHSSFLWLLAGLSFAGACYGGLHLVALASAFPSQTEAMMWRAGSVTIVVTGPFFALVAVCIASIVWLCDVLGRPISLIEFPISCSLYLLSLLWYTICRTFIVVECFILLAHIPETALHVPTWAAYIPSFS